LTRALLALAMGLACAKNEGTPRLETTGVATPAATDAAPVGGGKAACPATGLWSQCAVVERLDRAGLAPRVDSAHATEPPLIARGTLVHIGRSQLELYVYPDATAREREQARLDRRKYLSGDASIGMETQPTLVTSVNLIGILHSRNDHQRERVFDALTAGPPQPVKP
jgi:hypothetical protein